MRRAFVIAALLTLFALGAKGQESGAIVSAKVPAAESIARHARGDYEFGRYLVGKGLLRDATTLVDHLPAEELYSTPSIDSLRYLRGLVSYHNKQFDTAALAFGSVTQGSPFYAGSSFYSSVCHLLGGDTEGARQRLDLFAQSPEANTTNSLPSTAEVWHFWRVTTRSMPARGASSPTPTPSLRAISASSRVPQQAHLVSPKSGWQASRRP